MHLFSLALLYHIRPELEVLTATRASKIRDLLGQCLDNMKVLQGSSTLFRKAREALERFTQNLNSICKSLSSTGVAPGGRLLMLC
jgi:hypothetical protein